MRDRQARGRLAQRLGLVLGRRQTAGADPAAPASRTGPAESPACGWFESSHALRAGSQVIEHDDLELLANEVPLGWWVRWAGLGGGRRR